MSEVGEVGGEVGGGELGHIYNSEASSPPRRGPKGPEGAVGGVAYTRWSIHVAEHMFGVSCVVVQIHHMCCFPVTYAPVWWYW